MSIENTIKEKVIYPDPELERDIYQPSIDRLPQGPQDQFAELARMDPMNPMNPQINNIFEMLNGMNVAAGVGQSTGFSANFSMFNNFQQQSSTGTGGVTEPLQLPETKFIKFLRSKMHISLIATITYILISTNTLLTSNVFLVFLIWEMAEVFLLKTYETNKTSFLAIVFLLFGIPAIHSTIVIKLFETFNKILKDVSIFVFFFVCTHLVWLTFFAPTGDIGVFSKDSTVNESIVDSAADEPFDPFFA